METFYTIGSLIGVMIPLLVAISAGALDSTDTRDEKVIKGAVAFVVALIMYSLSWVGVVVSLVLLHVTGILTISKVPDMVVKLSIKAKDIISQKLSA